MAYKPKKKGLRIYFGGFIVVTIILCIVAVIYKGRGTIQNLQAAYKVKSEELSRINNENSKFVYTANRDIQAGESLTMLDAEYKEVYTSADPSLFCSSIEGGTAKISITKGTPLLKNMIMEDRIDLQVREEEFRVFQLSENLKAYDTVDIRILYPNGENYIVLSKKVLKGLKKEEALCYLWLDEQETLLISSAIIDAYMTAGTFLYTTRYVESSLQEESVVTYTPSKQIAELIKTSPNILETAKRELSKNVREGLELRLEQFIKEEASEKKALKEYLYGDKDTLKDESEEKEEVDGIGEFEKMQNEGQKEEEEYRYVG